MRVCVYLCICVSVIVRMCVRIRMCMCVCVYVRVNVCINVCVCLRVYACMRVWVYVCVYVCVSMWTYVCSNVYRFVFLSLSLSIYIYIYRKQWRRCSKMCRSSRMRFKSWWRPSMRRTCRWYQQVRGRHAARAKRTISAKQKTHKKNKNIPRKKTKYHMTVSYDI